MGLEFRDAKAQDLQLAAYGCTDCKKIAIKSHDSPLLCVAETLQSTKRRASDGTDATNTGTTCTCS